MKIDISQVLSERAPRLARYTPRFVVRWVENLICQDRLNELLENNAGRTDADFCRGVLTDLNVEIETRGNDNLPDPSHRRVVYVSNHPLGGLDGLALIDLLSRRHNGKVWFVVNDLLMFVKPLAGTFVPVNKLGGQSREGSRRLSEVFEGDDPILVFPAGLVSRKGKRGVIADLQWHKMCVQRAARTGRDIIPLHFGGANSSFFYNFAKLRRKLGLKINLEMALLPREMVKQQSKRFVITFGRPIASESLEASPQKAQMIADRLRTLVYELNTSNTAPSGF